MEKYTEEYKLMGLEMKESWLQGQINKFERLISINPSDINYPLELEYHRAELEAVRTQLKDFKS